MLFTFFWFDFIIFLWMTSTAIHEVSASVIKHLKKGPHPDYHYNVFDENTVEFSDYTERIVNDFNRCWHL